MGRSLVDTDVPEHTDTMIETSTTTLHIDAASNDEQHRQYDARLADAETALMKFLRPRRMIPKPAQRKVLNTAQTFTTDIGSVPIKTYIFPGRTADAPTVLLGHGFLYNAASMLKFVAPLRRAGYRVVTWDHCAHGESGGDFTDLRVWMRTLLVMAEMYAPLAGAVAFSVGSTVSLMALAEAEAEAQRQGACAVPVPSLVCINPPLQMDTVLKGWLRVYGYDETAMVEIMPLIHRVAKDKDVYLPERVRELLPSRVGALASTRVMVVQDRDDSVASVSEAEWVVDLLRRRRGSEGPNVELRYTDNLDHGGALGDEGVIRRVVEFLTSGAVLGRASRL